MNSECFTFAAGSIGLRAGVVGGDEGEWRVEGGGNGKAVSSHRTPSSEALPTGDDLRGLFKFGHRAPLPASKPSILAKKGAGRAKNRENRLPGLFPVPSPRGLVR